MAFGIRLNFFYPFLFLNSSFLCGSNGRPGKGCSTPWKLHPKIVSTHCTLVYSKNSLQLANCIHVIRHPLVCQKDPKIFGEELISSCVEYTKQHFCGLSNLIWSWYKILSNTEHIKIFKSNRR